MDPPSVHCLDQQTKNIMKRRHFGLGSDKSPNFMKMTPSRISVSDRWPSHPEILCPFVTVCVCFCPFSVRLCLFLSICGCQCLFPLCPFVAASTCFPPDWFDLVGRLANTDAKKCTQKRFPPYRRGRGRLPARVGMALVFNESFLARVVCPFFRRFFT